MKKRLYIILLIALTSSICYSQESKEVSKESGKVVKQKRKDLERELDEGVIRSAHKRLFYTKPNIRLC